MDEAAMIYLGEGEDHSTILRAQITADWRIQKLYEFLQISPSYLAAHQVENNQISKMKELPNDFDTVLEVYRDFGEVWQTSLEDWWIHRASKFFEPAIEPKPELVSRIDELTIRDLTQQDKQHLDAFNRTYKEFGSYWVYGYANQLFPDCAVIAVPLRGDAAQMKSKINKLVDQQFASLNHPTKRGKYSFKNSSRIREETLAKYLFVVRLRASDPTMKLAEIGDAVTEQFGHQKMQSPNQKQAQRELESQTSEMFRSALRVAEWAARMSFTNKSKLNQVQLGSANNMSAFKPQFDYNWIGQNIEEGHISSLNVEPLRVKSSMVKLL